ncbi:MAG: hypothetical protein AMXMBFR57_27190 [Acidimicrobiia bacterium]
MPQLPGDRGFVFHDEDTHTQCYSPAGPERRLNGAFTGGSGPFRYGGGMKTRSLVWFVMVLAAVAVGAWLWLSGPDNGFVDWLRELHGAPSRT